MSTTDESYAADTHDAKPKAARLMFMPWYPRDFASSTHGWPLVARGAYRELLDIAWDIGSLPADPKKLRDMIFRDERPAKWFEIWEAYLEEKFPVGADGRRRNPRLEEHRQEAERKYEARARAGQQGGKAKAERARHISGNGKDRRP